MVFPHSLAHKYKNSSKCTFLFLLYGNLVPEFVRFTEFEREFRCYSNFLSHLQEHSLPSNCLPKQKADWKAGLFFCFVICSLQTHLIPESGHHCKLLQSLHWLRTVFVTMQYKIAKRPGSLWQHWGTNRIASHCHIQKHYKQKKNSNDKNLEACFRADEQVVHNPPIQKAYRTLPVFRDGNQMVGRTQWQLEKAAQLSIDGVLVSTLT